MSMNREGRPTRPEASEGAASETWTGNRALMLEEPLIFEMGEDDGSGVDFDAPRDGPTRLGGLERFRPIGLRDVAGREVDEDLGIEKTNGHSPRLCRT